MRLAKHLGVPPDWFDSQPAEWFDWALILYAVDARIAKGPKKITVSLPGHAG